MQVERTAAQEFRFAHAAVAVRWSATTHEGMRRRVNEDSVVAAFPAFIVADGMGGHDAGDVASSAAIRPFQAMKGRELPSPARVERAVDDAFAAVGAVAEEGAGTTLAGAVLVEMDGIAHWLVVNVGDSRVYLVENGTLRQLSVDHSLVQELIDSGLLSPRGRERHAERHVITRALGGGQDSDPDLWALPAERGHRLLVCSDGLPDELRDEQIAWILSLHASPAAAADALVDAALERGARDNVSVVVVDVDEVRHSDTGLHDTASVIDADTVPRRP
ncbi:PP2C family protein-serine/threonine phosphatase [Agrococcus sp. KRD186]|jgi:protein phosphatase|uniref:PP2C family protein-serine/threonine phosphatase n=1 Tax=Agrococcus sp. KRD186 TaxID=2729730 RepID=UPI0019CF9851|nr:protein phosphatase 2C domain-containing protein [Agrococcus sp. KRD186]